MNRRAEKLLGPDREQTRSLALAYGSDRVKGAA